MNKLTISAIAIGLAFSAGAMAQAVSKEQYQSGRDNIAADYKAAKAACGSLSGNANDICAAQASGREKVAKAQLEAEYKPSVEARYTADVEKLHGGGALLPAVRTRPAIAEVATTPGFPLRRSRRRRGAPHSRTNFTPWGTPVVGRTGGKVRPVHSRAGSSHGEPRTEPRPPRRRSP